MALLRYFPAIKCPAGQIYEECSDRCYRSCADIESMSLTCRTKCVEGCRCPEGQALDDNNECTPISMCPCIYKGLTFQAGYKEVRPGTKHLDLWLVFLLISLKTLLFYLKENIRHFMFFSVLLIF